MEYNLKALKINKELNAKNAIALTYNNIGIIEYYHKCDTNKALENYFKSLDIAKEIIDKHQYFETLKNIGIVYSAKNDYINALDCFLKVINYSQEQKDKDLTSDAFDNVGELYIKTKEYKKAEESLRKSLQISNEIGAEETQENCYKNLSILYKRMNNWQLAMVYYQKHIEIKDRIYNKDNSIKIIQLQSKYELEKKDLEIASISQKAEIAALQNTRNQYIIYGLVGGVLLVLIITILLIRQYKQKSKRIAVELEQKLLRSQMNPHFIFNSLNAIQSYIFKNEIKESAKYLSGFAKLMRMILENSREEYISIEKEKDTLEYYLNLQRLRFENKFDFTLEIDPNVDIKTTGIPPMFAQPFIENALEHGIMHINSKGQINIRFNLKDDLIILEIQDNGVGRKKSKEMKNTQSEHNSLATTITNERITALNKKNKKKINLTILDIENDDAHGTKIIFTIPYKELTASQLVAA